MPQHCPHGVSLGYCGKCGGRDMFVDKKSEASVRSTVGSVLDTEEGDDEVVIVPRCLEQPRLARQPVDLKRSAEHKAYMGMVNRGPPPLGNAVNRHKPPPRRRTKPSVLLVDTATQSPQNATAAVQTSVVLSESATSMHNPLEKKTSPPSPPLPSLSTEWEPCDGSQPSTERDLYDGPVRYVAPPPPPEARHISPPRRPCIIHTRRDRDADRRHHGKYWTAFLQGWDGGV